MPSSHVNDQQKEGLPRFKSVRRAELSFPLASYFGSGRSIFRHGPSPDEFFHA